MSKNEHKEKEKKSFVEENNDYFIVGQTVLMAIAVILLLMINTNIYTMAVNGVVAGSGSANAAAPSAAAPSAPSAPTVVADMDELAETDAVKGDPNAPVTIVEWSDFECPFCARFYRDTLGQIETNYIDTGKVKLVYRDFPLSFHPNAQKAAEAAECAGDQGKYYEMHDVLFEKGVQGGVPTFKGYAADLGLNTGTFDSCLDSGEKASEISKDMADGTAAGIRGTPGFIINGKLLSGAQPYAVFEQAIEDALN